MKKNGVEKMKNNISVNTQSSIKISGDKIIYFDPFKIEDETHDADFIFITHDHYDHLDYDSINKAQKDNTLIIVPNSIATDVLAHHINPQNLIGVDPGENYTIENLAIETIPSYNLNKPFHPLSKYYVGYIITLNNERIYVAGDTDVTPEAKSVNCDIALVPIGGKFTCDYKEAAELINTIKPKTVIPTHYGSIVGSLNDGEEFKKLLNPSIECLIKIK